MNQADEIREAQRATWNAFAPGWKKWDSEIMDKLGPVGFELLDAAGLKDGDVVLDVATGTGEPGITAARMVGKGRVVGVDLSEEMVKIAGEQAVKRGAKNYEAKVADAGNLGFEAGTFDAVICRFGVMFFPDPPAALKEFLRVIKPGGRLALSSWGPKEKNPWATTAAGIVNRALSLPPPPPDAPGIFRHSAPGTLKRLLGAAGFEKVKERAVVVDFGAATPEEYWKQMSEIAAPIANALAKADQPTRDAIGREVVEAAKPFVKGGKVSFPGTAWVASGVKPA